MSKAIVIGSGIAGMASAIRLRAKGYDVEVYERNSYPGGKLSELSFQGYRFDAGPSLFTMPWLVDELFRLHDEDPKEYFTYRKKEVLCHYFWDDGTRFVAKANRDVFVQEAAETFGDPSASIDKYLSDAARKYDLTADIFLKKSLHKWKTYLSADTVKAIFSLSKLSINNNLHGVNQKYFDSEKLVQLFNRYATYNGSSPYRTPGIMSMIPHLEMNMGTFFPENGMHDITSSLYRFARQRGIAFYFDCPVASIDHDGRKVTGIITEKGRRSADLVVSNMDVYGTYQHLLPDLDAPHRTLHQEKSSSAVIFYWGMDSTFPDLDLHNIFFSNDYRKEFSYIFNDKTISDDPTIYINITSKENPDDAPAGHENWFVMLNTPANYGQDWEELKQKARRSIITKLNKVLGRDIAPHIKAEASLDPAIIASKTASHLGALYGASSNSKFSAFLRHPNFTGKLKDLYFCGGSVHPGGGIPLCLLSAKIVDDLIKAV